MLAPAPALTLPCPLSPLFLSCARPRALRLARHRANALMMTFEKRMAHFSGVHGEAHAADPLMWDQALEVSPCSRGTRISRCDLGWGPARGGGQPEVGSGVGADSRAGCVGAWALPRRTPAALPPRAAHAAMQAAGQAVSFIVYLPWPHWSAPLCDDMLPVSVCVVARGCGGAAVSLRRWWRPGCTSPTPRTPPWLQTSRWARVPTLVSHLGLGGGGGLRCGPNGSMRAPFQGSCAAVPTDL